MSTFAYYKEIFMRKLSLLALVLFAGMFFAPACKKEEKKVVKKRTHRKVKPSKKARQKKAKVQFLDDFGGGDQSRGFQWE